MTFVKNETFYVFRHRISVLMFRKLFHIPEWNFHVLGISISQCGNVYNNQETFLISKIKYITF